MSQRFVLPEVCTRYQLNGGESLNIGQRICTENGFHSATLQHDGNFVVKSADGDVTVCAKNMLLLCAKTGRYHVVSFQFATMTSNASEVRFSEEGQVILRDDFGNVVYESRRFCVGSNNCKLAIDPVSRLLAIYSNKTGNMIHSFYLKGKRTNKNLILK